MTKRFRMETIQDTMLPFIVDKSTAKQNGKFTSYKTYETHRKEKCLELVDLLNELYEENEQLKSENEELKKRDNLVLGYLTDEGIITFEKYNEIVDYLYKKWQKRNGDVE